MADIRPDRLMTCQSEQKSVVSQRPSVLRLTGGGRRKHFVMTGKIGQGSEVRILSSHNYYITFKCFII
jgi:hypothetical protein